MKVVILIGLVQLFLAATLQQTDFTANELESNPDTFHELLKQWDNEVEEMEKHMFDMQQEGEEGEKENAVDMMGYLGFAKYMNFTTYDTPEEGARQLQRVSSKAEAALRENVQDQIREKMNPKVDVEVVKQIDFTQPPKRERAGWAGINPQLGRNILSQAVASINNTWIAGGAQIQWVIDVVLFLLFPIIGGFMGIATFIAFESDKLTFHHMGLDQSKLYQGAMLFLKGILFTSFYGSEYYNSSADANSYYPKREMNPLVIPETKTVPTPVEIEEVIDIPAVVDNIADAGEEEDEFGSDDEEEPFDTDNAFNI